MTASRYSRTVILGIAMVVVAVVALAIATAAQAANPPGVNLPTAPVNATFVENYPPAVLSGGDSYFDVTLSNVPSGYDVGNSEYIAWCADPYSGPPPSNQAPTGQVTLLSTYGGSPLISSSTVPWNKINYLLNHKNGQPNNVVQPAIWFLITGDRTAWEPSDGSDWSCPAASACDALVVDADSNGGAFVPGPGQIVAVYMYVNGTSFTEGVDDGWQDTIMEVPVLPYDLGDLPDTSVGGNYPTRYTDNGPHHLMTNNLYLGACVDNETNGQPNTEATGDNGNLLGVPVVTYGTCNTEKGDEDGVARDMNDKWTQNTIVQLDVTVVGEGALACWIDWNGSGDLGDPPNKFINGGTRSGTSQLDVPIPAGFSPNPDAPLYVRCRLFPTNGIPGGTLTQDDYVGYAPGGEVEDYRWRFETTAVTLSELQATTLSTGERLMALLRSWLQR